MSIVDGYTLGFRQTAPAQLLLGIRTWVIVLQKGASSRRDHANFHFSQWERALWVPALLLGPLLVHVGGQIFIVYDAYGMRES